MYNIRSRKDLVTAINFLEKEVAQQQLVLADQFRSAYENFRLSNILKNLLNEDTLSDDLKKDIFSSTLAISAGYLLKKLFFKKGKNPLKKLLGNLVQYGVTYLLINPGKILRTISDHFNLEQDKGDKKKAHRKSQ